MKKKLYLVNEDENAPTHAVEIGSRQCYLCGITQRALGNVGSALGVCEWCALQVSALLADHTKDSDAV